MAHLHRSHHTPEWSVAVVMPSRSIRQMINVRRRHLRAHKPNSTRDNHHLNHLQDQLLVGVSHAVASVEVVSVHPVEPLGATASPLHPSMPQRVRLLLAICPVTPAKTAHTKQVRLMQALLTPIQLPTTMNLLKMRALRDHMVHTMKKPPLIARTITNKCHHQLVLPPTGPAAAAPPSGPKFSFAFKATSKTPVTAPKPEISQKFSATPARRDQPIDDRDHRDRDLPRDTPTEPASSRARSDYQRNRHQPQVQPQRQQQEQPQRAPEPPRIRRVRKIVRRPKPRPQLPAEHANAKSVYFRKPGNESVVGSGTYGKVFKGTNVYTKKLVALKKIRMEGERDGFPVTAVREIKLLQSLKHENIVNLMEVMVEDNNCYMVFEYLSHDLTGLLNHPSYKLDPAEKKHMAKQLFEGLDYLHGRGVLHRDIKAANILVSSDGILKIADFGLARFYAKHHRLDYTNRVITIWYRSPELLLGETQYTAAVDVWSAACVMVEIFTRHAIFPGDGTEINQLDKIYAILGTPNKVEWPDLIKMEWFELLRPNYRKPNVFAEKYKERVPAAAFELLNSMFHYDPAKRPSAAEVLEHEYFTTEQPPPRQATALANIQGDWHEFESKALRRAKEKQEREARQAAREVSRQGEKDKKRPIEAQDARETKRPHIEGQPPMGDSVGAGEAMVQ
ncbi:dual specificity protein kinase YAK1 [Apiospora arundinis]